MKLSPLRKQVESLNKELESQNIQIKDLINFLSKSTPKQTLTKNKSPRSNLKRLLMMKACFSQDKVYKGTAEKKPVVNQFRQSNSMKYLRPFNPIKNIKQQNFRKCMQKDAPMTKSVTFHNIQNALTTRKYLKLSKPQKRINASCSFCKDSTFGLSAIGQCQKVHNLPTIVDLQKNLSKSKQIIDETKISNSITKKSSNSSSKTKIKQKLNSDKKTPFRELNSNQILSKNDVKSFIEKKSNKSGNHTQKSKVKLQLKDQKNNKQTFQTKR